MKLSLKNVGGKLRLLVKPVNNILRFVKDCCCVTQDNYVWTFAECCNGVVRFAVTKRLWDSLYPRCGPVGQFVVRKTGDEACYVAVSEIPMPRSDAEGLGYQVYDIGETSIVCWPRTAEGSPTHCYAPVDVCKNCYKQCCIIALFPSGCAPVQNLDTNPKNNYCCNYGREANATWTSSKKWNKIRWITLNNTYGSPEDSWCQPSCYGRLIKNRSSYESSEQCSASFRKCDINGDVTGDPEIVSCNGQQYEKKTNETWIYGFDNGGRDLPSCTSFRKIDEFPPEKFTSLCTMGFPFPFDRFPGPAFICTGQDNDPETNCTGNFIYGAPDIGAVGLHETYAAGPFCGGNPTPLCNPVDNYISECTNPRFGNRYKLTTTYRRSARCLSGEYYLKQTLEIYSMKPAGWPDNEPLCPANGSLLELIEFEERFAYNIQREGSMEYCDPHVCDGYKQNGTIGPPVLNPAPITGALSLL